MKRLAGDVARVVAQQERDAGADVELGIAGRPSGLTASSCAWSTVPARTASVRLGDMANGHTQLTRMSVGSPLEARVVRLGRRTAALALEYAAAPGHPLDARPGAEVHDAAPRPARSSA